MKKLNLAIIGQGRSGRDIHGAFLRGPKNEYFNVKYVVGADEHLIAMLGEAYGWFPTSVITNRKGAVTTTVFRYPEYDIAGLHTEGFYKYTITRPAERAVRHEEFPIDMNSACFLAEWEEFYGLLGDAMPH